MGLSNELSCEAGSFSRCCLNPHRSFKSEAFRLYFPMLEPWVAWFVPLPLFLLVHPHMNVGLPAPPATALPGPPAADLPGLPAATSQVLQPLPFESPPCLAARLHPSYPSG